MCGSNLDNIKKMVDTYQTMLDMASADNIHDRLLEHLTSPTISDQHQELFDSYPSVKQGPKEVREARECCTKRKE